MLIIAFGHQSRVGKDTCAKILTSILRTSNCYPAGVIRTSFAKALKVTCSRLFGLEEAEYYDTPEGELKRNIIIPRLGKTPVEIWIETGNKLREVHAEVWIDSVFLNPEKADVLIISDLRFPNEAAAIMALGGYCIKVSREFQALRGSDHFLNDHIGWSAVITNDGTLSELTNKMNILAVEKGWVK